MELKPCPWCGGQPWFSEVQEKHDRRYMQLELECCATMSATIGWGEYMMMDPKAIESGLKAELAKMWNKRADPSDDVLDSIALVQNYLNTVESNAALVSNVNQIIAAVTNQGV